MTGASTGPGRGYHVPQAHGAPTPNAAAPAQPDTTPQPFLTPTQQAALTKWNVAYAGHLADYNQADSLAWSKYGDSLAADQLKNAEQTDATNQVMGARGMFQSSIRQNALNDLAATLTMQSNVLQTNRDAALFKDELGRQTLSGENAATQQEYQGVSVENAQSVTPPVNMTPPSATNHAASTGGVHPAGPSGGVGLPSPNTVTQPHSGPAGVASNQAPSGPPHVQGLTQRSAAGAARIRSGAPKPPGAAMNLHTPGIGRNVRVGGGIRAGASGGVRI